MPHQIRDACIVILAGMDRLHHLAQAIDTAEQELDDLWRSGFLAVPDEIEQRFHQVREVGDLLVAEGGRSALDGVRSAEDVVHHLAAGAALLEVQQAGFHRVEAFDALFLEDLADLVETVTTHAGCLRVMVGAGDASETETREQVVHGSL